MKRIGLAIVLTIAVGLLPVLAQTGTTGSAQYSSIKAPWERGEYIYQRFFAQVTRVNNEAAEAERLGMNSLYLRKYFQTAAQLQASQAVLLNQVATELAASLAQHDAKAAEVRKKWHILVQTKRLQHEAIPPIPAEILALQSRRETLILQARDRLRVGLGEAEFARLDAYVKSTVATKQRTETGSLSQQQPAADEAQVTRAQYRGFFRSIAYLNGKAEEERKLGFTELAAGVQTLLQRQAALTDKQAQILNRVTSEYFQTLEKYKPQAEAARLAYTKTRLEMLAQGGKITPTPELTAAQAPLAAVMKQMDDAADEAIRHLRSSFGEEEFGRLDTFVKQRMKRSQTGSPTATDSGIGEVTR